jgi:chromosomal replication initiation ATPase DnaA
VGRYLVRRMDRSFAAAAHLVEELDRFALSRGGPITVPLARAVLDELAAQSSIPSDLGVA